MTPSPNGSGPSPRTPDWQPLALRLGYTPEDIPRLAAIREEWDRELARQGAQFDPEYLDAQWRVVLELGLWEASMNLHDLEPGDRVRTAEGAVAEESSTRRRTAAGSSCGTLRAPTTPAWSGPRTCAPRTSWSGSSRGPPERSRRVPGTRAQARCDRGGLLQERPHSAHGQNLGVSVPRRE